MKRSVRILIADHHEPFRVGVRDVLEEDGFVVCAEAGDAREAEEMVLAHRPDVCLVDLDLPGGGLDAVQRIAAASPRAHIVALTASPDDEHLLAALRAGAIGYLNKDIPPSALAAALNAAARGEPAVSRSLVGRLIRELRARGARTITFADGRVVRLSAREWEVLRHVREGLTTAEIAEALYIADATVRSYISSLMGKFGVEDRDGLVSALDETS